MNLPDSSELALALDGPWLTVTLNRPETRNALSAAMVAALTALAAALARRRDVRGVSFRGSGGVFCAGGDLKAFARMTDADRGQVAAMSRDAGHFFDAIDALPQVTLMVVEGAAIAGGMGLICCADMVICDAGARFGLSETQIGLTPAQIAPFVLRRLGPRVGRRLMLTGARLDAAGALALGLVDDVADTPGAMAAAEARFRGQVLRCAPGAVAATKALTRALPFVPRDAQIETAALGFAAAMTGPEGREGVASFVEKRAPAWAPAKTA
jgi:enoyl-CoA hydratase/carnithine racemase